MRSRARATWWSSGRPTTCRASSIRLSSRSARRRCRCCSATAAAYAFSRFKVPLKDDLLFFILSTRMMPPIAVAIPIYLMYRELGLSDTRLGMILLYTSVNVSLAVWLLKGFIDEIPREYEEAAMVDGYTRLQAFFKVVLPQATTGIVATAIFCLIFAWNEYAFAVLLTSGEAQTAPPFIPIIIGEGGQDWPAVAAGNDAVPDPDPRVHRAAAQASAARHHVRGGAQMSVPETPHQASHRQPRRLAALAAARHPGERRDRPDRSRRADAAAAVLADALRLFLRHDARRRGDVHHRLEVPGVRPWPRSASRICRRASATSPRCATRPSPSRRRILLSARAFGLRQDDDAAHDRRPRAADIGRILLDGEDVTLQARLASATSPWCSSCSRSIRT